MSNITRHVGVDHLGNKLVVVFRELPEDPEHCLVVQSSTLPDMYHDNLMNVIESLDAQQTHNLYEVLNRRVFGDGGQILQTLHERGLLKKMSVDQVSLIPMPNRKLPLREANAAINGNAPAAVSASPEQAPPQPLTEDAPTAKVEVPGNSDDAKMQAQMLIEQARLLEADAKRVRDQAYALDPSLKAGGRPPSKKKAAKKKAAKKAADAGS